VDIKSIYARARRGVRDDVKLYLVAISSLTVAFLCLATALLGVENLTALAARWGESHRMTVYVREGASEIDVARLTNALSALSRVERVEYVSPARARERLLGSTSDESALAAAPETAFPASIDVVFSASASAAHVDEAAKTLRTQRAVVEDVDTYRGWFQRLAALVGTARAVALGLGLLVLSCVAAVVANTIRLAVANRREEIEVLKMCGATDAFVRAPFVLEGTLQGFFAALLALLLLALAYLALRGEIDPALASFAGVRLVFLPPLVAIALVLGGAAVGALGSMLSVRRYIAV